MPEIGDKFLIICEVIRPAVSGEMCPDREGKMVPVNNRYGNLFWARMGYANPKQHPEFLLCSTKGEEHQWKEAKAEAEEWIKKKEAQELLISPPEI